MDFKFFRKEQEEEEHNDVEWWREDAVVEAMNAMNANDNVRRNNVLYERIQFLEDQLVNIRDDNTQLSIELARLRRLTNT
jgi:hypothetical protein